MIDRHALLADLQAFLPTLEADLRERVREAPELDTRLREGYQAAREAGRTADAYEEWREEPVTQAAVAWILGCVFVRFMEDNGLVETPRLSGAGERLKLARDHHTVFFQKHPSETDREYLLDVIRDVATLPAARELFDERHNPLWSFAPSGDWARKLLEFWQRIDPQTGALVHDFTDPEWNTRFLGDLYQDLSETAREKYALLQTPEFVEEFILDRTLAPAIEEFGYREVRLIDPTCGSGHFVLGGFRRLFELRLQHEPGTNVRELAQRALDAIYGVDLNPFAVAIARFRLLTAALRACSITRLKDAPGFRIHLAVGDSLLHGPRFASIAGVQATLDPANDPLRHVYATEDREALRSILGQRYEAVVGNPPYITVKDKALNEAYRQRYSSCHRKYSLAVPFMERFFELALPDAGRPGFVGMITANSFMKREFGKKLVQVFIPRWDLTHVLDTSGAYIPGHGTPTVILFGRNRQPVSTTVRAVMGSRGEPETPDDPAQGIVWQAILRQVDQSGSESEWVSASDSPRANFQQHPWSIGGSGAAELKERLDEAAEGTVRHFVEIKRKKPNIGFASFPGLDEAFVSDRASLLRMRVEPAFCRDLVKGDIVRDWSATPEEAALVPYDETFTLIPLDPTSGWGRYLWPNRTVLRNVQSFETTREDEGLAWWGWYRWISDRYRRRLSITYGEVATHNHFVLDRGGRAFKQTAPVMKLKPDATEEDHLALLGFLNSSAACFWLRQVCFPKGGDYQGKEGARVRASLWDERFAFSATPLAGFPVAKNKPLAFAKALDALAQQLQRNAPATILLDEANCCRAALDTARAQWEATLRSMIAIQEELDWYCYRAYGLIEGDDLLASTGPEGLALKGGLVAVTPPLCCGERAFEIVLARRIAREEELSTWFERQGTAPITEIPQHWPKHWRNVVARRIETIETNADIRLIERPEYKRRWKVQAWKEQEEYALRQWLLNRLESAEYWPQADITTVARLADTAQADGAFMQVAALYRERADFDVAALVSELVGGETVPFLPILRYKDTGLRKRAVWERTWALQRREDRGEAVADLPVPPKYTTEDFKNGGFWHLRGKLDVPKERFISYPGCERSADPTLVIGWAGWNHLQQAQALAEYYVAMKDNEGWSPERLTPLLMGLLELLPWLEQWHNEPDPAFGIGMGEYFRRFLDEEARSLDLTLDAIRAWRPAAGGTARRRARRPSRSRRAGRAV